LYLSFSGGADQIDFAGCKSTRLTGPVFFSKDYIITSSEKILNLKSNQPLLL